jgi:hypothetical protein
MAVVDNRDGEGVEELPTSVPWCSPLAPPALSPSFDVEMALSAAPAYDEELQTPVPGLCGYEREAPSTPYMREGEQAGGKKKR